MELDETAVIAAIVALGVTAGLVLTAIFLYKAGVGQGKFLISKASS